MGGSVIWLCIFVFVSCYQWCKECIECLGWGIEGTATMVDRGIGKEEHRGKGEEVLPAWAVAATAPSQFSHELTMAATPDFVQ